MGQIRSNFWNFGMHSGRFDQYFGQIFAFLNNFWVKSPTVRFRNAWNPAFLKENFPRYCGTSKFGQNQAFFFFLKTLGVSHRGEKVVKKRSNFRGFGKHSGRFDLNFVQIFGIFAFLNSFWVKSPSVH